jgi:peptide/nickel transport system substrate-binding protein
LQAAAARSQEDEAMTDDDRDLQHQGLFAFTVSRRTLLRGGLLGGAGLAAAALIGCGDDDDDDDDDGVGEATATATATEAGGGEGTATATAEGDDGEETRAPGQYQDGFVSSQGRYVPYNFAEPATEPKRGGTLIQRYTFNPGPLDPVATGAGGTNTAINAVYNRVIGIYNQPDSDPYAKNDLIPELGESWETSADGLTYTFHIRSGVNFHNISPVDGRELTAEDVVFSWSRYRDEGAHRSNFSNVTSIDAPDANTVVITLAGAQPDFIYPLSGSFATIHPHELVDAGEIVTKAIGTGPMIVDFWTNGEGGAFDRNPDYALGDVKIDRWELPYVLDVGAAKAQFRVGNHDYGLGAATGDELEEILGTNPDSQYFGQPLFASTFALNFNMDLARWQDERVRRALSLAYDREELLDIIYDGVGVVLPQMDWRYFWDEAPQLGDEVLGNWWRYDPDEAKKLLDAAGASDIAFDLMFYNYSPTANSLQNEVLLAQYQAQGINMSLQSVDYSEYNSQWTTRSGETDSYQGWASFESTPQHYVYGLNHSESTGNRNRVSDPQIDAWAAQHRVELDEDVRTELARNVWNRMQDQVYRIEMASGNSANLQQPWVRGLRYARTIGSGHFYLDTGYEATNVWLDK